MNFLKKMISFFGHLLPKRIQRTILDFPGVLALLQKISFGKLIEVNTPEGNKLIIDSLFHYTLVQTGDLRDYEPDLRELILKLTKPGMVAYDIGANVGTFSFLFASIVDNDGIVYAFEPEENNFRCLQKAILINSSKNIVIHDLAVGDKETSANFDRRGGAFSGRLVGQGHYNTSSNIKTVETVSLDHLVTKRNYRVPDILKIDVEGNEKMVIDGMCGILEKYAPIVICEIHTHLGELMEDVTEVLSRYGYKVLTIKQVLDIVSEKATDLEKTVEKHIVAFKGENVM